MTPDMLIRKLLRLLAVCVERDMSPVTVSMEIAEQNGVMPDEATLMKDLRETIAFAEFTAFLLAPEGDNE